MAASKSTKKSRDHKSSKNPQEEHDQLLQRLQVYGQNNNAHESSDALVYWAQFYFNKSNLTGLAQIIDLINDEALINAINSLESSQYSANKSSWTGSELSSSVINFIKQDRLFKKSQQQIKQGFTPLNP